MTWSRCPELFELTELRTKLKEAVTAGLTPLILDPTGRINEHFIVHGAEVLDVKSLVVESVVRENHDEAAERARSATVAAMKIGNTLVMAMQQAAPDFGRFADALPPALFQRAGKTFVGSSSGAARMFTQDDCLETGGDAKCDPDFQVVLTTSFKPEEVEEYLFQQPQPRGLPSRTQFKLLEFIPGHGDAAREDQLYEERRSAEAHLRSCNGG